MSPGDTLVDAESLVVRRGRTDVVESVDLTVERGEVVAVLGPNGAGKSTLLAAIGGLLQPHSGRLDRTGRVATVLQAPGLANRSVQANVESALSWWGVPRGERRARALEALEQMHAGHLARRHAATLSGGERRRVHVARGIALRPDLLLLDEPFAGLDPGTRAALCEDTSSALRTSAGGVVVVVHDRDEAWALADRLVVMIDGRIAASGAPAEVLAAPPSIAVARFLGYDGELPRGDHVRLTRPPDIAIDTDGDHTGTVTRLIPQQDGVRLEITTADGSVRAHHRSHLGAPLHVGDTVAFRVVGGVDFERSADAPAPRMHP